MRKNIATAALLLQYIVRHTLYWIAFFALMRLVFVLANAERAAEATMSELMQAFATGLVFDLSIIGYVSVVFCAVFITLGFFASAKKLIRACNIISSTLLSALLVLMPANAVVYSYWGAHFAADSVPMLLTGEAFDSVATWIPIAYFTLMAALCVANAALLRRAMCGIAAKAKTLQSTMSQRIALAATSIIIAAVMVIAVRGGLGIAPLNTGRAYFGTNIFANHTALNPVWNFLYSLKRIDAQNTSYNFIPQAEAECHFAEMMKTDTINTKILKTERPNIIVILLESFSAHGVKYLGGENATPRLNELLKESVAFRNIMSASDRSGKGLVATLCGYQVLPTINAIQYPQKTQTMPFISHALRANGYDSQTFIYGGDLGFNCFNSLVTLAGFDNAIDEDSFTSAQKGDKWGAHDEFAFARLSSEIEKQTEPFFDFFFTLSSHEPYTVPMAQQLTDPYLNSLFYTDSCLGSWIDEAKTLPWWHNTVVILIADHGHAGPDLADYTQRSRFNIPLIFTGGAMAITDTIIDVYGSQTDLAATLLAQLGIAHDDFRFSKNLLALPNNGFAFFDYSDGFGLINDSIHTVYDNTAHRFLKYQMPANADSIGAQAYLQTISEDYKKR